jgi:hypothetical protein
MLRIKTQGAAALALMVLALAGCGGGGSGGQPANSGATGSGSQVPDSAQQSVGGLMAFLMELIAQSSDTTEPVALGDAALPTDDTSGPQPVN